MRPLFPPLIFTKRLCDAETYRPIAEIVEEQKAIELAARETDVALRGILRQLEFAA